MGLWDKIKKMFKPKKKKQATPRKTYNRTSATHRQVDKQSEVTRQINKAAKTVKETAQSAGKKASTSHRGANPATNTQKAAQTAVNAIQKSANKTVKKSKSIGKAVQKANKKPVTKVMTNEQALQVQNATRTQNNPNKAKNLLSEETKKVLAKNYSNQVKANKYVAGAMQGAGLIDTENYMRQLTEDKKGKSRLDEKAIKKAKESTGYKAAEAGGFMASALVGGVGGAAEKSAVKGTAKVLAKKAVKEAAKETAEGVAKKTAKKAVKEVAKESTEKVVKEASKKAAKSATKSAKLITRDGAKKFAANRIGDAAVNTPLNVIDAMKNAVDDKGNVSGKKFGKNLAVNVGMDMALGSGIDVAGAVTKKLKPLSKADRDFIIKAKAKKKAGGELSQIEQSRYDNIMTTVRKNAKAQKDLEKAERKIAKAEKAEGMPKTAEEISVKAEEMPKKSVKEGELPKETTAKTESVETPKKQGSELTSKQGKETVSTNLSNANKKSVEQPKKGAETEINAKSTENMDATPKQTEKVVKNAEVDNPNPKVDNAKVENTLAKEDVNKKTAPEGKAKAETKAEEPAKTEEPKTEMTADEPKTAELKTGVEESKTAKVESDEPAEKIKRTDEDSTASSGFVASAHELANKYGDDVSGSFKKVDAGNYEESIKTATERASKDFDGLWNEVMKRSDFLADTAESTAQKAALSKELAKKLEQAEKSGADITELKSKYYELVDKMVANGSAAGKALNYQKMLKESTPQGALAMSRARVANLQQSYEGLLKGKEIEIPEEYEWRLLSAKTERERINAMRDIEIQAFDQIPYTFMEKLNAVRRFSMLANPKTHLRNVLGNTVFRGARYLSDGLEVAITAMSKKNIEKMGGSVEMVKLSKKAIKENKDFLNDEFSLVREGSNSVSRLKEGMRPDEIKMFGNSIAGKTMDKLQNLNFDLLDAEDMLTFKPTFINEYARYCQSKGWDIKKLTAGQIDSARAYALGKAEYATFRDASALSDAITQFKTKSQTTTKHRFFYRAANGAIESVLPFVKTPINIFRRAVDFSPMNVMRATGQLLSAQKKGDAELLKKGIHNMATGLTGSGVFSLGVWLASQDLITTNTGDVSGDSFYDRDMGYQDYSVMLKFGDNKLTELMGVNDAEYSATADWIAPVQMSLFMGAEVQKRLSEKGFSATDIIQSFSAATGPMADMSFMSTAKDTISTFLDTAYRGEEASYFGATVGALLGNIPQGFLGSLSPQLMSQTAMASDSTTRDMRSTKKDALAKSWESFGRKMINRVPGLRKLYLNPKLDREGNDIQNGQNIVTRIMNSFINPANVKRITYNDNDKKHIEIFNHLPEGDSKKYYFYNFTGNPRYDLSNGKRMTYDEAYTYGKKQRQELNRMCSNMFNASSYNNMTWDMRGREVTENGYLAQTYADRKTYGNKYAAENIAKYNKKDGTILDAYRNQGGTNKDFVNFYIQKEGLINRCHDSDYSTKALAVALTGNKKLGQLYDIHDDKIKVATAYVNKLGREKARKEYSNAMCNVISGIEKAQVTTSIKNKAVSAADHALKNRTYAAMGITDYNANMGYGLKHYKYDLKTLSNMASDMKLNYGTTKDDVINYVESVKPDAGKQEKACLYAYLYGYFRGNGNPYGSIKDWLGTGYSDSGSKGSYGRRSYSRRGRFGSSGGSGGSSSSSTTQLNFDYTPDTITDFTENPTTSWKATKAKTNLNQAYINKLVKLGKNTHK